MGVTGSRVEPYQLLDARVTINQPIKYTVYDAMCTTDSSECSVFAVEPGQSEIGIALTENFVKSWKVYRHPVIATFIESYEADGIIYIVTERLLDFDSAHLGANEKAWALNNLARLVSFLGEGAGVVHGNLCRGALFLTPGLEVKVSGLHWATQVGNSSGLIEKFRTQWASTLPFSVDSGEEITPLFDCRFIANLISEWKSELPKPLLKFEKLWRVSKPKVSVKQFLELEYWENDRFVQYLIFLRELPLKDPLDRDVFLKSLLENIGNFDPETQNVAILPCLISALSYSPTPTLLAPILTIGRNLDERRFGLIVVPPLVSLFENKDRALRIHLLNEIEALVPFLDQNVANGQVFANVIGGLNDSSLQLRQATIIAMAPLAQFLTQENLSVLVRELRRLQIDNDAQIRTNSVICIAKIAAYLSAESRGQILVLCFSKAVIDPYVPARRAAIAAFKNCLKYFTHQIIAQSVIPAVAPLCVDPNQEVKDAALTAVQIFLNVLKGELSPQSAVGTPLKAIQRISSSTPVVVANQERKQSNNVQPPPPKKVEKPRRPVIEKKEEVVDGWSDDDFEFDDPDVEPVIEEPKQKQIENEDDGWELDSPWSDEEKPEPPKPKKVSKFVAKPARTGKKND